MPQSGQERRRATARRSPGCCHRPRSGAGPRPRGAGPCNSLGRVAPRPNGASDLYPVRPTLNPRPLAQQEPPFTDGQTSPVPPEMGIAISRGARSRSPAGEGGLAKQQGRLPRPHQKAERPDPGGAHLPTERGPPQVQGLEGFRGSLPTGTPNYGRWRKGGQEWGRPVWAREMRVHGQ